MPFTWIPGGFCLCREPTLTCEQAVQPWDSLLHREEKWGPKKYFQISSSGLSWPRWVAWWVWLTIVGASSSSTSNLPLGNSHHPFSVSMAPSALASWFWASAHFGEPSFSSGSSANTRALIGASLVAPKPSVACLVVLSTSLFPRAWEASFFFFFLCPQQCMTATLSGSQTASNRVRISSLFLVSFSLAVRRPFSLYRAPCTCNVAKACLGSV